MSKHKKEMERNDDMLIEKSWEEFRGLGLLWFINIILHTLGWVIIFNYSDGELKEVYPARTKYRGFSVKDNDLGYERLAKYMKDNGNKIYQEILDTKENDYI